MRKRIILGVAGAALFLVGILAGLIISGGVPAFASKSTDNSNTVANVTQSTPGTATGYCQLYEQTLASKLGISESQLEGDNSAALQAVLTQMTKDGTITSKQESILQALLQNYSSQPCSHLGQLGQLVKGGTPGALGQVLAGARQSIEAKVSASLGISAQTLATDLKGGQTIPEIASARNVQISNVNAAYLGAVQSLLAQAVSNGYLTQDQSNALYTRVSNSVKAGRYPLLQAGGKKNVAATPTTGV